MTTTSQRSTGASIDLLLARLAALDDVSRGEQDLLELGPPVLLATEQELEVHAEVLELLFLGVLHDGSRLGILLDRDPLLVPADRLRLLDERGDHAREGSGLVRQLVRRLVILLETHLALPGAGAAYPPSIASSVIPVPIASAKACGRRWGIGTTPRNRR